MTDIQITRFEQSHVQAVAQIEQACFADPWTEDGLREELDNSCARFLTAVTADGTVSRPGGDVLAAIPCWTKAILPMWRCRRYFADRA